MTSRVQAAVGSGLFLIAAPGTVAGLVPWLISGWKFAEAWPTALRVLGIALVVVGLLGVLATFTQFVVEGRGTPAPPAPTEQLVVHGLYRHVRNPMYLSVGMTLLGQAIAMPSLGVLIWTGAFGAAVIIFVLAYEQPTLRERYGQQYDDYRRAVPAWWPRVKPWRG